MFLRQGLSSTKGKKTSGFSLSIDERVEANPMSVTLKPEDILTPKELAARLKVRKTWVYEQTRSRSPIPLPRLNMGRYLRFDWVKVVEWLTREDSGDHTRKKRIRK